MFDDPAFTDLNNPRTMLIVDLLAGNVYGPALAPAIRAAGLSPGDYALATARIAWSEVVTDAAERGRLDALITSVTATNPALRNSLDQRLAALAIAPTHGQWYQNKDPYRSSFVGLRCERAVIDRRRLRRALQYLAEDQYRVLVVTGTPRSGKSHSWVLLDHLRGADVLTGANRFARVTTDSWTGRVTGEDLLHSLSAKLGIEVTLSPSDELEDTRTRKLLDRFVGVYPSGDGTTRWIVLDGLDRPIVHESARDLAKGLIRLVDDGELQQTRLIVTGLDSLGLPHHHSMILDEIPAINRDLLSLFIDEVASHFGHQLPTGELDAYLDEILGTEATLPDLEAVEEAVVRVAKAHHAEWAGCG